MTDKTWNDWLVWAGYRLAIPEKGPMSDVNKNRLAVLARRIKGQLTSIIMRADGTLSGGFIKYSNKRSEYACMEAEIKTHDPFQRFSVASMRTGNIPIWKVGSVIALGAKGDGK